MKVGGKYYFCTGTWYMVTSGLMMGREKYTSLLEACSFWGHACLVLSFYINVGPQAPDCTLHLVQSEGERGGPALVFWGIGAGFRRSVYGSPLTLSRIGYQTNPKT